MPDPLEARVVAWHQAAVNTMHKWSCIKRQIASKRKAVAELYLSHIDLLKGSQGSSDMTAEASEMDRQQEEHEEVLRASIKEAAQIEAQISKQNQEVRAATQASMLAKDTAARRARAEKAWQEAEAEARQIEEEDGARKAAAKAKAQDDLAIMEAAKHRSAKQTAKAMRDAMADQSQELEEEALREALSAEVAADTVYTVPLQNAMQQQMEDLHVLQRKLEEGRRKVLAASSSNAVQKLPYLDKPSRGTMAVATATSPLAFWNSVGDGAEETTTGSAGARDLKPMSTFQGATAALNTPPKVRKVSDFLLKYMCKYEPGGAGVRK